MKTLTRSLFLVSAPAGVARVNAFNINEHDAKVTGRGGAAAASNTDASSVIFNPGGIPVAEGTQVAIAGAIYVAQGSYEPLDGSAPRTETDSSPSIVPSIYATTRINKTFAAGIGFHLPFGLAVSWPDGHPQADVIQDQTLRTYFITPAVGINLDRVAPGLSIGGGVDIVPATIQLERAVNFGDVEGTAVLGGDALGIGGRVGVMYRRPSASGLKLGLMYRSAVQLDFEGNGDFDIAQPYRDALPADGPITAAVTLPQAVTAGVAFSPIPELELEFDAVWIDWSEAFANDQLRINLPGMDPATGEQNFTAAPQDYSDTTTLRFGAEAQLTPKAAVRAGFVYDPTPIANTTQTAQLPDVNRRNVTLGGSYLFGDIGAHLGLLWVTPGYRDTNEQPYTPAYKAKYGVQAFVASLMVTGSFGK